MASTTKQTIGELLTKLKQERDELRVKIHLGSQDLKDEWGKLEDKFIQLNKRYEPLKDAVGETAENVWESLKIFGDEIKEGFHRIRKSL